MSRGLLFVFLVSASSAFTGAVQSLPALPNGAIANAVQVDAAGNIYVAGEYFPSLLNGPGHAVVGKLSPDGSQVVWWKVLAGSKDDRAFSLALGSDNSVYITGSTSSLDFPTTSDSAEPTASISGEAFAVKLDSNGAVVYSTYIGGAANASGNAIVVDPLGRAFITGYVGESNLFQATPGTVRGATGPNVSPGYVIELDTMGRAVVLAINGFGGSAIALDLDGNIYAAGALPGPFAPVTPGAFQSSSAQNTCDFLGLFGDLPCGYQYIAKLSPTGTRLIFATYVAGVYGATPKGISVDSSGNVILAGSTNSPDYPTTPGAYQPEYFALPQFTSFLQDSVAPPSAGYVTKLNASGTDLIWSTLLAGSGGSHPGSFTMGESVAGMAIDTSGNILVSGLAYSPDLPGLWDTPVASRPSAINPQNFVARLSPDGTAISPTQLLPSSTALGGIAVRADGTAVFGSPMAIVAVPASANRVATICDTADNAKIVSVAPGQLLTLYGTNLGTESISGVSVTFNGIPAPILYTSGIQINLQVPYEVDGLGQVTMRVVSQMVTPPISESYTLAVVKRQPSVFLSAAAFSQPVFDVALCQGQNESGLQPLALNADGTQNSCENPAPSGSVVTVFLNGMGVTTPAQTTGAVSPLASAINPSAVLVKSLTGATTVLSTTTLPGSIDSIAQVQIQVSSTSPLLTIPLGVTEASGSTFPVRGSGLLIWVRQ
jgi:uncharacterized protein (TIGR03437 family)